MNDNVGSHSHSHSHSTIDPTILATDKGIRTLKISLVGLLLTAMFQVVIVWISGSAALLADTLHNFADAFTAVPLWIAFRLSKRKPTRSHTYGYGKAEDLAGMLILLVVSFSALVAGYESVQKFIRGEEMREIGWVAAAAIIGFLGNEIVAVYRIKTGKEIGSAALVADGHHSRIDGLTSLAVLVGAIGVWLGFPQADPIVGILISLIIVGIVIQVGKEIFKRVMDIVDPKLLDEIEHAACHVSGVISVHDVRVRWIGHLLHVELNVAVASRLSVTEGHEIAKEVRHQLLHNLTHLGDVIVHVDPEDKAGEGHHHIHEHTHDGLKKHSH